MLAYKETTRSRFTIGVWKVCRITSSRAIEQIWQRRILQLSISNDKPMGLNKLNND